MRITQIFSIAIIAAALAVSGAAAALAGEQEPAKLLGVVELFTSQGCNSCPPRMRRCEKFAARGDVVALGYHVDYWDYLGWSDTLGSKANSEAAICLCERVEAARRLYAAGGHQRQGRTQMAATTTKS
jgi:hypothetical protein